MRLSLLGRERGPNVIEGALEGFLRSESRVDVVLYPNPLQRIADG